MKKYLSLILVLLLCVSAFVACLPTEQGAQDDEPKVTLDDAVAFLKATYMPQEGKETLANFDLIHQYSKDGVKFTITWTVDNENIKITLDEATGFYVVKLPASNPEKTTYTLTATITGPDGKTAEFKTTRVLPVLDNVEGVVTEPVVGEAYKLFFHQKSLGKVLFLLGVATNEENKYIKTTIDPKEAPDFFVEEVDGGYKIYTMVDSAKTYVRAATTVNDAGEVSKYLGFDTTGTVFKYNKDYDAWYTVIDNVNYVMGTYKTYDTASLSDDSYYTEASKRATQFAVAFMTKATAEAMTPTEGPADPTELTSIKDLVAKGEAMEQNTFTVEKYLVKGTVTEINSDTYGNMHIADEEGNTIYVYGLYSKDGSVRFDAMETQPKVGDIVTIMGIVGNYNGAQIKNGWLMDLESVKCTHVYDDECDAECNNCKETRTAPHKVSADCDVECDLCKAEIATTVEHTYSFDCDKDCDKCGATRNVVCVDEDGDAFCDICGEVFDQAEVDASKIEGELANLDVIPTEAHVGDTCDLPDAGKDYSDVKITWEVTEATYKNGKVTFTNNGSTEITATLKATLSCGKAEDVVKEYTVKVTAHIYDNCEDGKCNICEKDTRTPKACTDANNNYRCDVCKERIVTAPVAGVAYKFYMFQQSNNKILYFNGDINSSGYFTTTDDITQAVDLYLEQDTNGYYIYFEKSGAKKYIKVDNDGSKYLTSFVDANTSASLFNFNAELRTMTTEIPENGSKEGGEMYLGTYGTYDTISASRITYASTSFVGEFFKVANAATCGHDYLTTCVPKCYICGTTNSNITHDYAEATCSAPKTCKNCKKTDGAPIPHTPSDGVCSVCSAVVDLKLGVEYYLTSSNKDAELAFNGTLSSGRINADADFTKAVKVILEAGEKDGEYYITFMKDGVKNYLAVNPSASGTQAFVFATEKNADAVWIIDTQKLSIISKALETRGIGSQTSNTYKNFSTYDYSANSNRSDYDWAWFVK